LFASRAYVSLMRGTPLLVQLLVLSYGLPLLGIRVPPILAAILAIELNSGAYATEILRGGVLSIAPGQIEAAKMVGLSRFAIWRRIVLPQAMASSLPMLVAEFSIILKSTPLASIISVTEMTYAGVLIQARSFSSLDVFLPIAAAYVAIFYAFTMLAAWLDRQLAPMRG
jgi:polar amino acid transport system permease protein